jgi:hypothetical protein
MLLYNLASHPQGISSWATATPDSMPLPEATSTGLQSTIQSVPRAVPVWGGTVSGPPTTDPRLDPAMNCGFQGPPQPHVHQHNEIPIGLPTQCLDLSVPSAQPSLLPQALLMNPSENVATHQSSQQALTPNHLFEYVSPSSIDSAALIHLHLPHCLTRFDSYIVHSPLPFVITVDGSAAKTSPASDGYLTFFAISRRFILPPTRIPVP